MMFDILLEKCGYMENSLFDFSDMIYDIFLAPESP